MPESLRVALLLSTRYFEDFYGAGLGLTREQYLSQYRNDWSWDWCHMLAEAGVHATIYVPTIQSADHVATADGYSVRFLRVGALAAPWVRFPVLERTPAGRYIGQAFNAAAFLRGLREGLIRDRIDVICVQEYWTARFDVIVRAVQQAVVAVDQGMPERHEVKALKRGSFRRCSGAIVQTEREAMKVARYGGRAVRVPNAVDTRLFSPPERHIERSETVVLCVGRIHDAQKRLSDVIRALALLPSDWRLEIAGSGPDRPVLERLASALRVASRVAYLGFVSEGPRLRDLYHRASVVALPSAYEGLPMVLLEAMSCGTPVVGSNIAAIAEVVESGRTGLLAPVGDPAKLAEALLAAVAGREELGRAARAAILSSYDQAVVVPRLIEVLRESARSRSRAA